MKQLNCVVRVQTEAFKRGDSYFYGKSIRVLKKLTEYDVLHEECQAVGVQEGLENLININIVDDGLYQIVIGHASYDCETGYLDDWDLKLIPYVEAPNEHSRTTNF